MDLNVNLCNPILDIHKVLMSSWKILAYFSMILCSINHLEILTYRDSTQLNIFAFLLWYNIYVYISVSGFVNLSY